MKLLELLEIASAFVPVDTQTAANTGDYVCLKGYERIAFVFFKGAGTANDDPVVSARQATDVADTSGKALNLSSYWKKEGTLTAVTYWTEVTQTAAATTTLSATSAESEGLYVFDIAASDLDVANGFDCVRFAVADTGSAGAQLGAGLYILYNPRYPGAVAVDPITD